MQDVFFFFARHGALWLEPPWGCIAFPHVFQPLTYVLNRNSWRTVQLTFQPFSFLRKRCRARGESYQTRCPMQHAASVGGVNWKTWMQYRWPMHSGNRVTSTQQAVHHDYGLWELKKTRLKFSKGRLHCYSCLHLQRTTLKGPVSKVYCHLQARKHTDIPCHFRFSFNLNLLYM